MPIDDKTTTASAADVNGEAADPILSLGVDAPVARAGAFGGMSAAAPPAAAAADEEEEEDEEDDDEDDTPEDGEILEPGVHLIEVATRSPCRRNVLLDGMAKIGFRDIRPDESVAKSSAFAIREHRFLGNLSRSIRIHQRDVMKWMYAWRVGIDVNKDVRSFRPNLEMFELKKGQLYEALFISRLATQPKRQIVEENLGEMGFIPVKLSSLRRDVRIQERELTSAEVWYGLIEWDTIDAVVTDEDPFYFEELRPV